MKILYISIIIILILFLNSGSQAQSPQAFSLIKIGQYAIYDSTGIPRTPGKDSLMFFARGKLGFYMKTWEGNVFRIDSAGSATLSSYGLLDSIRQGFGIIATRINDSVYTIAVDTSAVASLWDLSQYEPKFSGSTTHAIPYTDDGGTLGLFSTGGQTGILGWEDNSITLHSSIPTALGGTGSTSYTPTEFLIYSGDLQQIISSGYDVTDFLGSSATAESAKSAYWATKVRSDSVKSASKADSVTSPNTAKKTSDNNFTAKQTLPKAVTDSIMTLTNMLTIYNEAYFKVIFPDSMTINHQNWTEDETGRLSRTGDLTFYTTGDSASDLRRWAKWQAGVYTESGVNYQTSSSEYGMQMQLEGGVSSGSFTIHSSPASEYPDPAWNELFYLYAGDAGNYARFNVPLYGSSASGGSFTLGSTSHATKGGFYLGDSIYISESGEAIVLGAKTITSGVKIETVTDGGSAIMKQVAYGSLSYSSPYFYFYKARGSLASPSAVVSGDILGSFNFFGYHNGSAFSGTRADFRVMAAENFTSTANGTYFTFRTTPIGSTTIAERMRIADNGNVGIGTTPATSGALDVASTTGALIVPRMTTTQRDALTAVNGMIIYNTTTNAFNFYENSSWVTK